MTFAPPPRRRDAPDEALCALKEIPDGQGRGFALKDAAGRPTRNIFVVRQGRRVHGYLNVCPHAGTPLDFKPDTFLAPDGGTIQCSTHGARFRIDDGACVAGPCNGRGLTAVPIHVDRDGVVRLDETT